MKMAVSRDARQILGGAKPVFRALDPGEQVAADLARRGHDVRVLDL
jgi:hypothetical protein